MIQNPHPGDDGETQDELAAAYAAYDDGDLREARLRFERLLALVPDAPDFHYMLGLVCKYLRDWPCALEHNLRSIALRAEQGEEEDEASCWNAAIAATALGDWAEARRQWAACGIDLPGEAGPIDANFGVASLRLEPWGRAETLFARRIDPVRAELINVPLPETGYRFGDVVLHDGASTGERIFLQSRVPVLNALQRLETSEFRTFAVFATCPERCDLEALLELQGPGIGHIEDWTANIVHLCLRCSYGVPHRHREDADATQEDATLWRPERTLGVAAQGRPAVLRLIERWKAAAPRRGRRLDALECRDHEPDPPPLSGRQWWIAPRTEGDGADEVESSGDNPGAPATD